MILFIVQLVLSDFFLISNIFVIFTAAGMLLFNRNGAFIFVQIVCNDPVGAAKSSKDPKAEIGIK